MLSGGIETELWRPFHYLPDVLLKHNNFAINQHFTLLRKQMTIRTDNKKFTSVLSEEKQLKCSVEASN